MTQPHSIMKTLLLGLGSALLATACTVTLDPNGIGDGDGGDDAQCLELFETCVELAGESPGCEAVFEFCSGGGSDDGGMEPDPGCEENYINCLQEGGVPPEACEPLLWECEPGGDDDGGACEDDPEGCEPSEPPCDDPNNPDCQPTDCDQLYDTCVDMTGGEEGACEELLPACYDNDCDAMLDACYGFGGVGGFCEELTGCYDDPEAPADDCDQLLNECYDMAEGDEGLCQELYPDCFDNPEPPQPGDCEWYSGECYDQFIPEFCEQGGEACQNGVFPEQFDCSLVFPDYCVDVSMVGCDSAEQSCWDGFQDVVICGGDLSNDPAGWVVELIECNGWNEG